MVVNVKGLTGVIFPTLLFLPVFFSFSSGGIGFDRVGGFSSGYFISLPVSYFVAIFLILKQGNVLIKNKFVVLFFFYSAFIVVVNTIYNADVNFSIIKILTWMNLFIIMIIVFQNLFKKILDIYSGNINSDAIENRFVLYPLLFVLIGTIISYFYIGKYSFIMEGVKIYNFEQYFSFLFVILLAVSSKNKVISLFLVFPFVLFVSVISSNMTAYYLTILMLFFILLDIFHRKIIYVLSVFSLMLFFIVWPLALFFLGDGVDFISNNNSLFSRYSMANDFLSGLVWYQVIFPYLSESRSVYADMHNEFLEVFNATGVFGIMFYYYFILKRLTAYTVNYRVVGLSIAMVIFLGGTTVENTLHPYLLIALAYMISFYFVLSNIDRKKQKSYIEVSAY